MDVGGRATKGAVAEDAESNNIIKHLSPPLMSYFEQPCITLNMCC